MLPAVDDAVLKGNPDFANLYRTLTVVILNPDGTTKNDTLKKERDRVHEELKSHRLNDAKKHLLSHAVATATPPEPKAPKGTIGRPRPKAQASDLPDPLLDLMFLLPPLLSSQRSLSPQDADILLSGPPFSDLPALLPELASLVSATLHSSATSLVRVANPSTNPSFLHRSVPSLAQSAALKATEVRQLREELVTDRLKLIPKLTSLLEKETRALGLLIRSLEAKHGVVARSLELRAAEVSIAARIAEIDARAAAEGVKADVYPPESVAALRNYGAHLRDAKARLEENIRMLERELEGYGVGVRGEEAHEGRMREMGRVWKGMEREMEEVRRDLDRLGRA